MKFSLRLPLLLFFGTVFGLTTVLAGATVRAQSNAPVGGGGTCSVSTAFDGSVGQQQAYNNGLYFCSGGTWKPQSLIFGPSTATCASALSGMLRFTSSTSTWEYCNGTAWTTWTRPTGYLVQTLTKWNGNLGGLSGADAKCLTELDTTYNWKGKATAGTLTAARVKSFLCDGTTCNNLRANTPYLLAVANSTTSGGLGFITDSSGRGPNAQTFWDAVLWSNVSNSWTNRGTVDAYTWATTPKGANHCTNWTSGLVGVTGGIGNAGWVDAQRWDKVTNTCNTANFLICMVNPE